MKSYSLQLHPRPPPGNLQDRTVKDYATYKKVILFFAIVDQLYANTLSGVSAVPSNEAEWPSALAEWIRSNDDALLKASARVLSSFQVCSHSLRTGNQNDSQFLLLKREFSCDPRSNGQEPFSLLIAEFELNWSFFLSSTASTFAIIHPCRYLPERPRSRHICGRDCRRVRAPRGYPIAGQLPARGARHGSVMRESRLEITMICK